MALGYAPEPVSVGLAWAAMQLTVWPASYAPAIPARSLATAIFGGTEALSKVWLG